MERVITPQSSTSTIANLWESREVLWFLVWRDIKVRYKQTIVGISWVIIQPFLSMVVFSFIFGNFFSRNLGHIPYPIFVYTSLLFWNLFSKSVTASTDSLLSNRHIITKVYFPRLVMPIAAISTNLVDFFFSFLVLFGIMAYYHFIPHIASLIVIPIGIFLIMMMAIGLGSFLASINLVFRDIGFILPFALQLLLYTTPILYPSTVPDPVFRPFLKLNPLYGVFETVRTGIFGNQPFDLTSLIISIFFSVLVFLFGIYYFNKFDKKFADIL